MNEDFKWEFMINLDDEISKSKDIIPDYIKYTLKEILEHVALTYEGKKVKIDGFKFKDPNYNENIKLFDMEEK